MRDRKGGVKESGSVDEVHALADAVLEAARVAGLGVAVSFDDGEVPRLIYVNDAAAEILGYTVEELVGNATAVAFAAEERQRMQDLTARWRRGETTPSTVETVVVRKDGERIPVEIAFSVVPLSGEPASVTFIRDIRERRRAEQALRRSEQRFRQLIEAAPEAIGVCRDGRLVYVNPAHVALFGRSFDELVGRPVTDFLQADDHHMTDRLYEPTAEWAPHQGPEEYRIAHPDGRVVSVEMISIPIEYEGRPAMLGFTRDTTESKKLQTQLALSDRMATLGLLAAGVAHEINNPLTYAKLNVETLVRHLLSLAPGDLPEAIAPAIAAARDGLARVGTIVRDLQSLSMPTSADRWPVDVKEVLESALNVAMHAIRNRARVVRNYEEVMPLKTDPTRLGQILLNLVLNAAQAYDRSDEATNVLSLGITSSGADDVLITVADNGPGIAKERLARIFEPFYTTKNMGMGLGLAICQTLATSLGARLAVESEVGRGTTFTLHLSCAK
jgi:PAS domain S-box-containing protein